MLVVDHLEEYPVPSMLFNMVYYSYDFHSWNKYYSTPIRIVSSVYGQNTKVCIFYDVYFEFIEHFLQILSSLDITRPS